MPPKPAPADPSAKSPKSPTAVRLPVPPQRKAPPANDAVPTKNDAPAELTVVVDDLLDSLATKFASVSGELYAKMDAMSKRLDAMEALLGEGGKGLGAGSGAAAGKS